jgi:hypothetical protein
VLPWYIRGMATLSLASRLVQAEDAYHAIMTGRQALVVVDQNGERVEYNRANAFQLAAYIRALKTEIANPTATPITGPMGIWF